MQAFNIFILFYLSVQLRGIYNLRSFIAIRACVRVCVRKLHVVVANTPTVSTVVLNSTLIIKLTTLSVEYLILFM
jgi:hypothetical protein